MKNEVGDKEASKVVTLPMDHDDHQEGHFSYSSSSQICKFRHEAKSTLFMPVPFCPYTRYAH